MATYINIYDEVRRYSPPLQPVTTLAPRQQITSRHRASPLGRSRLRRLAHHRTLRRRLRGMFVPLSWNLRNAEPGGFVRPQAPAEADTDTTVLNTDQFDFRMMAY